MLSKLLVVSGAVMLGWVGLVSFESAAHRREGRALAESWRETPAASPLAGPVAPAEAPLAAGAPIGVLEIPRLGYSEAVAEGDVPATLDVAIGHLSDTPLPWRPGNSVLAGHRDTHFRALRKIVIGDRLRLRTPQGAFEYLVDDKLIVTPDDLSVLGQSPSRRLTLVTCYPFSYIGSAPQRFIVRAVEVPSNP